MSESENKIIAGLNKLYNYFEICKTADPIGTPSWNRFQKDITDLIDTYAEEQSRPASGERVPQYDVNVRDIHHAIDILMEHIEQADGNTAILICEINDELHDNKLLQIQLRAVSDPALFVPAPPNPDDEGGEG